MKWISADKIKIEYRKTYYAKWPSGLGIKSTGKFQESDGTFFWNEQGYIPIAKKEYPMLLILDESEQPSTDGWISSAIQPKKPGIASYEHVPCLVSKDGDIKLLLWNCEHLCWDDKEGDDFECNLADVDFYYPLSQLPPLPNNRL